MRLKNTILHIQDGTTIWYNNGNTGFKRFKNKRVLERGLDTLSTYGIMKDYKEATVKEIIMALTSMGYINVTMDKYPILLLTKKSLPILKGELKVYHKEDLLYPEKKEEYVINTEILKELKNYRDKVSSEKNLPPFMIFSNRTLEELANLESTEEEDFLNITGMGLKKFNSYGDDLKKIIDRQMLVEGLKEEVNTSRNILDRYYKTYQFYEKGSSLVEIGEARGFTESTIINHLEKCEEMGYSIDWSRFVDRDIEREVLETIDRVGVKSLKDIKENTREDISYEDIKLVMAKNKR